MYFLLGESDPKGTRRVAICSFFTFLSLCLSRLLVPAGGGRGAEGGAAGGGAAVRGRLPAAGRRGGQTGLRRQRHRDPGFYWLLNTHHPPLRVSVAVVTSACFPIKN